MNVVLMIRDVGITSSSVLLVWISARGPQFPQLQKKIDIHPQRPLAKFSSKGGKTAIILVGFGQSFLC